MAKTAIFPAADTGRRRSEHGFTLFELLIAIAILAVAAGFVGAAMGASLEGRRLDRSVREVVDDLRRARLSALESGEGVLIETSPSGYNIAREAIDRTWPREISAEWRAARNGRRIAADRIVLKPDRIASLQLRVVIERGDERRIVIMDPVTGRVRHE